MANEIVAKEGFEVICTDDNKKCIISQIHSDSYYLEIHSDSKTANGWTGRSANISDIKGSNGETIYHPNYIGSKKIEKDSLILVKNGSDVYNKIAAVFQRIREVNGIAFELCKEFGGVAFYKKQGTLAGGIHAIKFENGKPSKDWKKLGSKYVNVYVPSTGNTEIIDKINNLPIVENDDLNEIYGFPTGQFVGNNMLFMPLIEKLKDNYVLTIDSGSIIAIKEGMSLLSKSDYYKLKGE